MTDREKFEKMASGKGLNIYQTKDGSDYLDVTTHWAWIGFQAALSSRDSTPTEGVGKLVVEEFLDEIHEIYINHDGKRCLMIPEADMPKLFSCIDRALAAPRMKLDLRDMVPHWSQDGWNPRSVIERIRQQLPNVEILT